MDHADRSRVVGRAAELDQLDELVAGLQAGQGGLAWLQGEPGIGKSALVDAAAAAATAAGCLVLRAAGEELMQLFPLRLMAECLGISVLSADPVAAEIAGLLRGDPAAGGVLDPVLRAAERMLDLVDQECAAGPVLLAAEDLQWADEPSLLLWGRLARAVDQIPLLLIGTARPLPQRARLGQLRELAAGAGGSIIDLRPLDAGATARLAGQIAGGDPDAALARALERAGGNPLYVRELTEALIRDGLVHVAGGTAGLDGDSAVTPASLQAAISSRLGFLPAGLRATLRMAALLGREFDAAELAAVTGQPVAELAAALTDAVADGTLAGAGPRHRFRHQLIHQVLADETPEAIRAALHSGIAATLAADGRPVDSVARHLLAVPGRLESWAVDWLAGIGEAALFALPQVSAALLGRAAESAGMGHPRWELLTTRLAQSLQWLGRSAEASQVAAQVIGQTPDRVLAARMRILQIRAAGRLGRPADGLAAVLTVDDADLPLLWQARLGAWSAQIVRYAGREREAAELARQALAQATASGDPLAIAYAHHASSNLYRDPESMLIHINAALGALTARDPESLDLRAMLTNNQLGATAHVGPPARLAAVRADAVALALADAAGTYLSAIILSTAASSCYRYGQWDDALSHLAGIAFEPGATGPQLCNLPGLAALIALHREERAAADEYLRAGVAGAPSAVADPPSPLDPLTQALATQAEADGDLARAVTLWSAWLPTGPGLLPEHRSDDLPHLVRVALAAGDPGTARAAAQACAADAALTGSAGRILAADFCAAQLADDAGALAAVAARYADLGWRPYQAFALEEAAVRLAARGDAGGARAALATATEIYAGLGASWDIRRADARLRAHGIRRGPRSRHRRAATGWAALTPSEARIAGMVARGLSNPDIASELFLSRRTVQAHVSSILGKLELRSRVGIMQAAGPSAGPAPERDAASAPAAPRLAARPR
jgi:DNA-binding CsgD family transcriptional regulator